MKKEENRFDDIVDEMMEQIDGAVTQEDMMAPLKELQKRFLEKALNSELDLHLGYTKNSSKGRNNRNSRNGYSNKNVKTGISEVGLEIPRDRESTFEPEIIRKGSRRLLGFDNKILTLYAKGQTTRDIADTLRDLYDINVSHSLISQVTESVMEELRDWQLRPLDPIYPILYLDCIVVKVHQDHRVINKSIYLALGVTTNGRKDLLGIWINETEGAKFWMNILTELQTRGVKDIFIACVDGLSGFPEAISVVFPRTQIQLCVVHMMRNSLAYVSYKDKREIAKDLKKIYRSINLAGAENELELFSNKWDTRYPVVSRIWKKNWANLITIFNYPDEIRKIIYTTNAIESLNSVIRKAIKNRKIFPNDNSAMKIVYLAIQQASRKWSMPLRDWAPAMNRFYLEYGERL